MHRSLTRSIWMVAGFIVAVLIVGSPLVVLRLTVGDGIFPRVKVGGVAVGLMSVAQATESLGHQVNNLNDSGLRFRYDGHEVMIPFEVQSFTGEDISRPLVEIDTATPLTQALAMTQTRNVVWVAGEMVRVLIAGTEIPLEIKMNREEIHRLLDTELRKISPSAREPTFILTDGDLAIAPGVVGTIFDIDGAIEAVEHQLATGQVAVVSVAGVTRTPDIADAELVALQPAVEALITRTPLALVLDDRRWDVTGDQALSWLHFYRESNGQLAVTIEGEALNRYIEELAQKVNREASPARFELTGGRVVRFERPRDGYVLDQAATERAIRGSLQGAGSRQIPLITSQTHPADAEGIQEDLWGIRELVGVGITRFTGSPPGRVHNIKNGAAALHGLIIKPDDEFSLVKAIGDVDGSSGYLQELVIKGDKVTKEFGGGLCQIATTVFRGVMDAGLPVTERRNHSLRVAYYEPPVGKDATIYGPHPDLRFVNDTGYSILLQTKVEGIELHIEFWGTRDGRITSQTDPIVWNQRPAPPPKLVETEELKPGEKKCTGHAYPGASAKFTYTVTYADGQKKEKEFISHYRPLGAICLVGKEKSATPDASVVPPDSSTVSADAATAN